MASSLRVLSLFGVLSTCSMVWASDPLDDAERIVKALDIRAHLVSIGPNALTKKCIEESWPFQVSRLHSVLRNSFSPKDLNALASFLESRAGKKWNQRSSIQAYNLNPANKRLPIPDYAPGEKDAVERFLSSLTGQNFLRGAGGRSLGAEVQSVSMALGEHCYAKHDSS